METRDVTFCNLTDDQINAIKILLGSDCKTKEDETPFPQNGDEYYLIYSDGEISHTSYCSENYPIDRKRLSLGNIFKTREEAEFEVERLKVLHEMKQFEEPKDYEWGDNDNPHYYIYWSFCYI